MAAAERDPFLNEDPVELISAESRSKANGTQSEPATDELGMAAADLGDEFASNPDDDFQGQTEKARAKETEVIDASLFDVLPETGNAKAADEVIQSGFQASARTANSGLGSASPWGSVPTDESDLGVELSFEAEGDSDNSNRSSEFPIDLDNFPSGNSNSLQPHTPKTSDSDRGAPNTPEGNRWSDKFSRLNLFGSDTQVPPSAETEADKASPADVAPKRERKSIRDRFSKLGARFGLTDGEEPPAPSVVASDKPTKSTECLDDLIQKTQARLAEIKYTSLNATERETYLRDQVNLRLFYLANNQHERALDAIPSIPPAEQEFWQQMFWSLSQYRNSDAVPDRTERITQTVSQLRTALQRLQETARLQLGNVSFCRRIDGYGNYQRFEKDVFKPGDPVLVYAEIENFRSEPTTAGQHRTLLRSTLQILPDGGTGKALDSVTLKPVEDICRNARRDYFNSYEFTIPNDIGPGRYVLEITVDDQLSGKSTKQSILFSVP